MKKNNLKSVLGTSLVFAALSTPINTTEVPRSTSTEARQTEIKKELHKNVSIRIKDNTHQVKAMKDGTRCEFKGL